MGWEAGNVSYLEVRQDGDQWNVVKTNNSQHHFPQDDRVRESFDTQNEAYEWAKREVQIEPFAMVAVQDTDGNLSRDYWAPRHRRAEVRPVTGIEAEKYRRRKEKYGDDIGAEPYWAVYVRDERNETHYDKVWSKPTKTEIVEDAKMGSRGQIIRKLVIRKTDGSVQEEWTHPLVRRIS